MISQAFPAVRKVKAMALACTDAEAGEDAGAVVPPRVPPGFRVMQSVRIDESRARQPRLRLPLAIRNVRTAMTGHRVPPSISSGRHIEITASAQKMVSGIIL